MLLFYFLSVASPASVGLHFPERQDSHDTIPFQENRVSPAILQSFSSFSTSPSTILSYSHSDTVPINRQWPLLGALR